MNREKFRQVFKCADRAEVIKHLLENDPAENNGWHNWKKPYSCRNLHCIYNQDKLDKGSYCSIEYYIKASVAEVARVSYKAETLNGKQGARVELNGVPVGWVSKDLSSFCYIPEQIFAHSVMIDIYETMLTFRRDIDGYKVEKVICDVKEQRADAANAADVVKQTQEMTGAEIDKIIERANNCPVNVFDHPEVFAAPKPLENGGDF